MDVLTLSVGLAAGFFIGLVVGRCLSMMCC